jgi:hypothetical protein
MQYNYLGYFHHKEMVISTSPSLNQRPQKGKLDACPSLNPAQMHEK